MSGRPWSWITGRPRLTDGVVVALSLLISVASALGASLRLSALAVVLLLSGIASVALWWRRSHPTLVAAIVTAASVVAIFIAPDRDPANPALIFAVYAVSAYSGPRARLIVVAAAIALVVAGVLFLVTDGFETARRLMPAGVTSLVAWVIGDYMRSRRAYLADLVARNRQEREQAAEDERLRIARELHDVVAHNVSVMAIQAGAARVSGNPSPEALASIESTARDTLSELNRLVGVLRHGTDGPALSPQPGLAQVESLIKPLRDAGIDVRLKVAGERRDIPAALDLSAFRIVQEALTNVLKHARASRVDVMIDYAPDALILTIADNGSGLSAPVGASTGHGLIGMRERTDLFGGDLSTGTSALGGFTVRARLPLR
jgi:signal transduction histidine kinase